MGSSSEAALVRAVLIHGPLPRSALTGHLGLSPASLTRLAKPLIDNGLLVEQEGGAGRSIGRPSRPLDISPTLGSFVGVKLTGDHLFAVATDARATALRSIDLPLEPSEPSAVQDKIVAAVAELDMSDLQSVGVSLGGFVQSGDVISAPFLGWHDIPLGRLLSERLQVPVTVDNDLTALAEAERWFGFGRGSEGFALITIGAGVGYALVIGDRTVRTADAGVGAVGHIQLDPYGPWCSQGHRGCAEALLTSDALASQVSTALRRPVTYDESIALAADGDRAVLGIIQSAGDALGKLISLTMNLTLQSTVILAGEGIPLYDIAAKHVAARVAADRPAHAQPVAIRVDRSGFGAWARGAAVIAIQDAVDRLASTA